jgi:hypothetical protein
MITRGRALAHILLRRSNDKVVGEASELFPFAKVEGDAATPWLPSLATGYLALARNVSYFRGHCSVSLVPGLAARTRNVQPLQCFICSELREPGHCLLVPGPRCASPERARTRNGALWKATDGTLLLFPFQKTCQGQTEVDNERHTRRQALPARNIGHDDVSRHVNCAIKSNDHRLIRSRGIPSMRVSPTAGAT